MATALVFGSFCLLLLGFFAILAAIFPGLPQEEQSASASDEDQSEVERIHQLARFAELRLGFGRHPATERRPTFRERLPKVDASVEEGYETDESSDRVLHRPTDHTTQEEQCDEEGGTSRPSPQSEAKVAVDAPPSDEPGDGDGDQNLQLPRHASIRRSRC